MSVIHISTYSIVRPVKLPAVLCGNLSRLVSQKLTITLVKRHYCIALAAVCPKFSRRLLPIVLLRMPRRERSIRLLTWSSRLTVSGILSDYNYSLLDGSLL